MKIFFLILSSWLLVSCSHQAKNNNCSTLAECLQVSSKLTGNSYVYQNLDLKEPIKSVGAINWTKENADLMMGELLLIGEYARIKNAENSYTLIRAQNVRYQGGTSYKADKLSNDDLPPPNPADYLELVYETKNGMIRASQIARNLRPFLSQHGRVIEDNSGIVIVRDHAKNALQLLNLMRKMDVPVTKAEIEERKRTGSSNGVSDFRGEALDYVREMMKKAKEKLGTEDK